MSFYIHFISLTIFGLSLSCSNESSNSSSNGSPESAVDPQSDSPSVIGISGQLSISLQPAQGSGVETVANANFEVVGRPELSGNADEAGVINIPAAPGTLSIIATSTTAAGLLEVSSEWGVKLDQIIIKANETTDLGEVNFRKTGSLIGKFSFQDNPNHLPLAGSDIYIPGTSYIAKSGTDGGFALKGLPVGTYQLYADRDGFARFEAEFTVSEGETKDIGTMQLSISSGPEGSISVSGSTKVSILGTDVNLFKSRAVMMNLKFDSDSALMKLSPEPTFLDKKWIPVAATFEHTFESDGLKSMYVKYSDLNGLESSPYKVDLCVDTEAPVLDSISLLNGWSQSAVPDITIGVLASDTGCGVAKIVLSNSSSTLVGASELDFSHGTSWSLSTGIGVKTVFAKVIDFAGNSSLIKSDGINIGAHTIIDASIDYLDDVVLTKPYSPYLIKSDILFKSSLEVQAGVTVYLKPNTSVISSGIVPSVEVQGTFKSLGSAGDRVSFSVLDAATYVGITNSSQCGDNAPKKAEGLKFIFNNAKPGVSENNLIEYTDFTVFESMEVNGGTIRESLFDNSLCSSGISLFGKISKSGLDNFLVEISEFKKMTDGFSISAGNGNTIIQNITGEFDQLVDNQVGALNTKLNNSAISYFNSSASSGDSLVAIGGGSLDLDGVIFSNVSSAPMITAYGSDSKTITNYSVTGCGAGVEFIASSDGPGLITFKNASINCTSVVSMANVIGSIPLVLVAFESSVLIGKKSIIANYDSTSNISISQSTIECDGSTLASGFCDLVYHSMGMGDANLTLAIENNTITCEAVNNCRGLTFSQGNNSNARNAIFEISTINNNTYIGKMFNGDISVNQRFDTTNNEDTTTDTEIKIFRFDLDATLPGSKTTVTTTATY